MLTRSVPQTRRTETDPRLPPGSNCCKCVACGLHFLNVAAFDRHRAGPSDDRACLLTPQLSGAGLEQDAEGRWRLPKREFPKVAA